MTYILTTADLVYGEKLELTTALDMLAAEPAAAAEFLRANTPGRPVLTRAHQDRALEMIAAGELEDAASELRAALREIEASGTRYEGPHPAPVEVATQTASLGAPPAVTDPADRQTMLNFVSMGNHCELGFAQRRHGAEPINLFRRANVEAGVVCRAMNERFADIGNPDYITVEPSATGHFGPRHTKYPFVWHAWAAPGVTPDAVRRGESLRLPRLAEALMDDLASGDRVFVFKRPEFEPHVVAMLRDAAQRYGAPTLLLVTDGAPVSAVRRDGFLWGTVPAFADSADVPRTTDAASWLALCRMAERIWRY